MARGVEGFSGTYLPPTCDFAMVIAMKTMAGFPLLSLLCACKWLESMNDTDILQSLSNHQAGAVQYTEPRRRGNSWSNPGTGPQYHDRGRQSDNSRDFNSRERGAYGRSERSRSPRENHPCETRVAFDHKQRKSKEDRNGNLSSAQSKVNAAVRIVLSHWLDAQCEGYQSGPPPKKWNIHPTVLREYRKLFQLPVDPQVVFQFKETGKRTAHFLDQSWRKPRGAVHKFWSEYGAVAAPPLDFSLEATREEEEEEEMSKATSKLTPKDRGSG